MPGPRLYHWARCSDCRRARETLDRVGYSREDRDHFERPLERLELEALARRAGGVRAIFAFRSPTFRALGRDPESVTENELVEMILKEPRMLRRPILDLGGRVVVGRQAVEAEAEQG